MNPGFSDPYKKGGGSRESGGYLLWVYSFVAPAGPYPCPGGHLGGAIFSAAFHGQVVTHVTAKKKGQRTFLATPRRGAFRAVWMVHAQV